MTSVVATTTTTLESPSREPSTMIHTRKSSTPLLKLEVPSTQYPAAFSGMTALNAVLDEPLLVSPEKKNHDNNGQKSGDAPNMKAIITRRHTNERESYRPPTKKRNSIPATFSPDFGWPVVTPSILRRNNVKPEKIHVVPIHALSSHLSANNKDPKSYQTAKDGNKKLLVLHYSLVVASLERTEDKALKLVHWNIFDANGNEIAQLRELQNSTDLARPESRLKHHYRLYARHPMYQGQEKSRHRQGKSAKIKVLYHWADIKAKPSLFQMKYHMNVHLPQGEHAKYNLVEQTIRTKSSSVSRSTKSLPTADVRLNERSVVNGNKSTCAGMSDNHQTIQVMEPDTDPLLMILFLTVTNIQRR